MSVEEILEAVRVLSPGERARVRALLDRPPDAPLSPEEEAQARLLAAGLPGETAPRPATGRTRHTPVEIKGRPLCGPLPMSVGRTPDNSERLEGLAEQGERFYAEHLREILEPEQTGRFVAIESETGRYFIGGDGSDALVAAHEAMPEGLFYLKRIGYEFAHRMGGRSLRRLEEE